MKNKFLGILLASMISSASLFAQKISFENHALEAVNVSMSIQKLDGKNVVRVVKDSTVRVADQPTYAKIVSHFKNGTIEVKVLSRLLKTAPESARGFIGLAFRINDSNTKFESIYIRPTNGRADNQLRRNHSTQYFSYPDYSFDRLRKEAPGEYESYADMGLDEWITMKIVVKDAQAKLFLNNNKQPSLVVNDLKLGTGEAGAIGLWVDVGTEGFFTGLKISTN